MARSKTMTKKPSQEHGSLKDHDALPKAHKEREYSGTVSFLLHIPVDIWIKFVKTVPISRTRHDFIIDLIERRIWEYEKATMPV